MECLTTLTVACTAFSSWTDLIEAIGTGYVPTIYGTTRRNRLLRKTLKAYFGRRVYHPMLNSDGYMD